MKIYQLVNPYTGEAGEAHPAVSDEVVEQVVAAAASEYATGSHRDQVKERAAIVARVADLLAERAAEFGEIIVREMGKPLAQAVGEVEFSADIFRYFADNAEEFLADEKIDAGAGTAWIRKAPIGPIVGIMPWNFPIYQIARFAGPSMILGNPVIIKPAQQCPESSAALEKLIRDAGYPVGGYQNLFADSDQIAKMIDDPRIHGVSLTGSERAGGIVAAAAGASLKKSVLELGGSDPFILMSTDDIDATVEAAVAARIDNNGQACNGAKRFIVIDDLYEEFAEKFSAAMGAITVGDPMEEGTELGPLSSESAAKSLEEQVAEAVAAGATLRVGTGKRDGNKFAPAVLENISADNPAFITEFFGPVAHLHRVNSEEEAVELANATPFGLGSYVFTTDADQADRIADGIDAGMVYINEVGADAPELPFGGVKNSGTGRELGPHGVEEFMNRKLVKRP
ncbi:succinate-semialdehyde dehydrogenase/glutarate-semialdehyde dehydrogenase [Rhodoglobus vestalii]|uniref:Succinate-semialdehyde dehydrogenase/glutarate-semialdehyde dehydrogenase n=1 Tax=Rhodoglobus vestalii TaxID=193384 RepID=A0A8H2PYA3_9MICO|nr:NAD-dependent succinate-semialdehyde dehydrogenase [Rhodoglobus vestalii]TQO20154.1 succinate-semialdehyde dehydrogenase/glutarate-semialdehyde dehydrogenase [Rhodoglobus vestalii]